MFSSFFRVLASVRIFPLTFYEPPRLHSFVLQFSFSPFIIFFHLSIFMFLVARSIKSNLCTYIQNKNKFPLFLHSLALVSLRLTSSYLEHRYCVSLRLRTSFTAYILSSTLRVASRTSISPSDHLRPHSELRIQPRFDFEHYTSTFDLPTNLAHSFEPTSKLFPLAGTCPEPCLAPQTHLSTSSGCLLVLG